MPIPFLRRLPKLNFSKNLYRVIGGCALAAFGFAWYVGWVGGNFRVVSEGHAYRCGQLDPEILELTIAQHKIRTVVNLRGGKPGDEFHDFEVEEAGEAGAVVIDIPLSATHLPPPKQVSNLVHLFATDQGPFLIHCKGGADRSGLASAIYRIVRDGIDVDSAEREQLTWRYGHLSFGEAKPMDEFFELYDENAGGMGFSDWVEKEYPAVYAIAISHGAR